MMMAATALVMTACSNDETGNNGPVELRLTSGVEVQQSRAAASTQETKIADGEVVRIWVDDAGAAADKALYQAIQLTADGNNGLTSADAETMYFPQTGNQIDIYAVHGKFNTPFRKGDAFPTSAVEYSVEADQSAGGTHYTNSDLLYAYTKGAVRNGNPTTVNLTFYHMLSKLELAIKVGAGAPSLATSGDAVTLSGSIVLNGNFTPSTSATMTEQSARAGMLSAATNPQQGIMTLGHVTCTDFSDGNIVYNEAILVPQVMSGKVLAFKLADGGQLTYTIPVSTTFESGKKYLYHITLDLTGITVTSKIEKWNPVAAVEGTATMQ